MPSPAYIGARDGDERLSDFGVGSLVPQPYADRGLERGAALEALHQQRVTHGWRGRALGRRDDQRLLAAGEWVDVAPLVVVPADVAHLNPKGYWVGRCIGQHAAFEGLEQHI